MRDMAKIVTIKSYDKMFEKDRIVCAQFNEIAYEAIIPIDNAILGNQMVFIESDSILPEKDTWEFLRKRCYRENLKGFLIKPMTMGAKDNNGQKGDRVKSWGLAITLQEAGLTGTYKTGSDVTDELEIRKYEPEEDASPKSFNKKIPKFIKFCMKHRLTRWIGKLWFKKNAKNAEEFPTDLISKSDETAIQNMQSVLETYANETVNITAKLEGQSFTVIPTFKKNKCTGAYVCSRNLAYKKKDDSVFWKMMEKYDIVNKMKYIYKTTGQAYIIQGEQIGPGIQSNIYDIDDNQWFVFTIKNYKDKNQLSLKDYHMIATNFFGLKCVPVIDYDVKLSEIMPDIQSAISYTEKIYWTPNDSNYKPKENETLWKDYFQHEGIVIRTENYDKDNGIGISFKVKNLQYAEKGLESIHKACIALKNNTKETK